MNKKVWCALGMLAGLALAILGFFLNNVHYGGVCIGVGAGLFGGCVSRLWMIWYNGRHPKQARQQEIEFADERNTMLRNKAKAKTSDIIQWCIMGVAYLTILIDAPLWITLVTVGVFLLKTVLEIYLMDKYGKEL